MNTRFRIPVLAAVGALGAFFTLGSAHAAAPAAAAQQDREQLQANHRALARAQAQAAADESDDSMRVYRDRQFIAGEREDITADCPGALQRRVDRAAPKDERATLRADAARLRSATPQESAP